MSKYKKYEKEFYNSDKPSFSDSERIGRLGEIYVEGKFIENNIPVFNPASDNGVDMMIELNGEYKSIQIKSSTKHNKDSIKFRLDKSISRIVDGKRYSKRIKYDKNKIDYFALCDVTNNEVYLLNNEGQSSIVINTNPHSKKNKLTKYADDYKIENVIKKFNYGKYNYKKFDNVNNDDDLIVMIKGIDY